MTSQQHRITSVRFHRYKAFRDFSISLDRFNILVGPNNCGKSTILGAFRILAEAMRRARSKTATFVDGPTGQVRGHAVPLGNIPVATENVFHNYDDSTPASVTFRISTGDKLILFFPQRGVCNLICDTSGRPVLSPSTFKSHFNLDVGVVPILGPVEHDEQLYQRDAAREALLTHRASRNFRNIWHHYPDQFPRFRELVQSTWPGMDIKKPEVDNTHDKPLLRMFCPEERMDREIFWAGFGFQVWCQMLTFMVMNSGASLFIIDEPDIYLHSDLQRQLVSTLRGMGPDILLATHSTEIIAEADPHEMLLVGKRAQSAKRVGDPSQLRAVFATLGSNLNPTLTQIARSKRVVFVEGKDFLVISRFAGKLNVRSVAMRSDFAVVPTQGFNPVRARTFVEGGEATLGAKVKAAVLFDEDFRSDAEVKTEMSELQKYCSYCHIHNCSELENFLLVPSALTRCVMARVAESVQRGGTATAFTEDMTTLLLKLTDTLKHDVQAQYLKRQHPFLRGVQKGVDDSTITSQILSTFDRLWSDTESRLRLVPGKDVLSQLNIYLQKTYAVTVTAIGVIDCMSENEVPKEMKEIILALDKFSTE